MRIIKSYWDVLIALVAAVCAYTWATVDFWNEVSTEIIMFFGIQSATVMPAMIFAGGILRPDGGTVEQIRKYKKAIRSQMNFWVVLLFLDFLTVVAIIASKGFSWILLLNIPFFSESPIDVSWVMSAGVTFFAVLAILRTIPLVKGILSLFELHSRMTEKAALDRNAEIAYKNKSLEDKSPFQKPEGFGRISSPH